MLVKINFVISDIKIRNIFCFKWFVFIKFWFVINEFKLIQVLDFGISIISLCIVIMVVGWLVMWVNVLVKMFNVNVFMNVFSLGFMQLEFYVVVLQVINVVVNVYGMCLICVLNIVIRVIYSKNIVS